MNQKTSITIFAVFIGAMMILSAFAGFVLRGGDEAAGIQASGQVSKEIFGVSGRLVDMSFAGLEDVLLMSPKSTVMAYWIDLGKSQNLTDAAQEALPQTVGLRYRDQIYSNKVEKMAAAFFNDSSAEFHWIKPYRVSYESFVIPYQGFMMIPQSSGYTIVLGTPALFGPQKSVENVLDVMSGDFSTGKFTLPIGEQADLQLASLGSGKTGPSGNYQEFYLGVTKTDSVFALSAKYLSPDQAALQRAEEIARQYRLVESSKGSISEFSGPIDPGLLEEVLKAFMSP